MDDDTTALQERIAQALTEHWRAKHTATGTPCSGCTAAVMPLIAAEVRKASEKAWDDCAHEADRRWLIGDRSAAILHDRNPYRATEKEADARIDRTGTAEARIRAALAVLEQQHAEHIGWDAAALLPTIRRALEG